MGFDDLFERGHHQQQRYGSGHDDHGHHNGHHEHDNHGFQNNYHNDHENRYAHPYSNQYRPDMKRLIMDKLSNNPQLKTLLIVVAVVVIVLLIVIAVLVVPLLLKFAGYISEEGIQGLINNIWKGSK